MAVNLASMSEDIRLLPCCEAKSKGSAAGPSMDLVLSRSLSMPEFEDSSLNPKNIFVNHTIMTEKRGDLSFEFESN